MAWFCDQLAQKNFASAFVYLLLLVVCYGNISKYISVCIKVDIRENGTWQTLLQFWEK